MTAVDRIRVSIRCLLGLALAIAWMGAVTLEAAQFPKILFDGYLEGKYSLRRSYPTDRNRDVIEQDAIYKKLPSDLIEGPGRYEHRLRLRIDAKLDEKLSAIYDIEQEPDFPAKYDIKVIHDKTQLQFFNFDVNIAGTSFANASKALNGVYLQHDGDEWDVQAAFGRQRSDPKKTEFRGTGESSYKIGQTYIYEGSVKVIVNDKTLDASEYEINYIDGTIKFKTPKSNSDVIKVLYEFTNPAADFIPVLSRKNFTLARVQYSNKPNISYEPSVLSKIREILVEPPPKPKPILFIRPQLIPYQSKFFRPAPLPEDLHVNTTDTQSTPFMLPYHTRIDLPLKSERQWLTPPPQDMDEELQWIESSLYMAPDETLSDEAFFGSPVAESIPATRTFQLQNYPVVPGSETLWLSTHKLRVNRDYLIQYRSGTVVFPNLKIYPQDSLWINYRYYETGVTTDLIEAKDSQGPYYLRFKPVVRGSEIVEVNNDIFFRDYDYKMDYDNGKLLFELPVQKPKAIKVTYTYYQVHEQVDSATGLARPQTAGQSPLRFGMTYLNESARPEDNSLVKTITEEASTLTNNLLLTLFNPITLSEDFSVVDIGTTSKNAISTASYTLDPYHGIITLADNISASITASSNLRVNYSYRESFVTEIRFNPDGRDTYYTATDLLYTQLPMKYRSEEVLIMGGEFSSWTRLERDYSYEIDYSSDGQNPKLRFIRYDAAHIYSALHDVVDHRYQVRLKYYFTPEQSPDQGQISHTVAGVDGEVYLDNGLHVGSELAYSHNNVSKAQIETRVTMNGTGVANEVYNLGQGNIVEDSEEVFVNDRLQSKNNDYIVSYLNGTLRFRNQTPSKNDQILVNYKYLSGTFAQAGQDETDLAWRMNSDYQLGDLQIYGQVQNIGNSFTPMGGLPEPAGSSLWSIGSAYKFNPSVDVALGFDQRRRKSGTRTDDSPQFTQAEQGNIVLRAAPIPNTTLRYQYNFQSSIADATDVNITTPSAESFVDSHYLDLGIGDKDLGAVMAAKTSREQNRLAGSEIVNNQLNLSGVYNPYTVWFLNNVLTNYTVGISRALNKSSDSDTVITNYGVKTALSPLPKLDGLYEYTAQANESKNTAGVRQGLLQSNSNYYRFNYTPFRFLRLNLDNRRAGSLSPLANQAEVVETEGNFQVEQFTPYELVAYVEQETLGSSNVFQFLTTPVKDVNLKYSHNNREHIKDDRFDLYNYQSQQFSLTGLQPIPLLRLNPLQYNQSKSLSQKLRETSSGSTNIARSDLNGYGSGFSLAFPDWPLINKLSYQYSFSTGLEDRSSTQSALVTQSVEAIGIRSFGRNQSAGFQLGRLQMWPLPWTLLDFNVAYSEAYNTKIDDQQQYEADANNNRSVVTRKLTDTLQQTHTLGGNVSPLGMLPLSYTYSDTRSDFHNLALSGLNTPSVNSTDVFDNSQKRELGLSGAVWMLLSDLMYGANFSDAYYNRNRYVDVVGSVYNQTQAYQSNMAFSPLGMFLVNLNANYTKEEQLSEPTINIGSQTLQALRSNVINKQTWRSRPMASMSPFSFIGLSAGFDYLRTSQYQVSSYNLVLSNVIDTGGLVGGVTLYPANFIFLAPFYNLLNSFQAGYTLTLRAVRANDILAGTGATGVLQAAYNPKLIPGANISLTFTQTDNRGKGINNLDQLITKQSANEILITEIKDLDDTSALLSLKIDVQIPVQSNVISTIVVTGEWDKKVVGDRKNTKNNYNIDALVFRGRVNF